jgi:hypothetical protein
MAGVVATQQMLFLHSHCPFCFQFDILKQSLWSGILYRNYMMPYSIPRNQFFASSEEEVQEIVKNNPKLREKDFILPRADVKTLPMLLYTMRGTRADLGRFIKKSQQSTTTSAFEKYKMEESLDFYTQNFKGNRPEMTKHVLEANDGVLPVPFTVTPTRVSTMFKGAIKVNDKELKFPDEDTKPALWGKRSRFSIEAATAMSTNFLGLFPGLGQVLTNVREVNCGGMY